MKLKDLFESDVTRDIPPVVYFHEQSPEKLADEVREYIITGGWPAEHPNHQRVPDGVHEQYVLLLTTIASELNKKGGPDLPNVWISGFYGSGKSRFAKLLGLALDGKPLPGGTSMAEAWLARDKSPLCAELVMPGPNSEDWSIRSPSSSTSEPALAITSTFTLSSRAWCRNASGIAEIRRRQTSSSGSNERESGARSSRRLFES